MSTATARRFDERIIAAYYKTLIATPGTGAITLPFGAYFAIKSIAGNIAGATALTYTGYTGVQTGSKPTPDDDRTVKVPALAAGVFYKIGRIQRAAVVTISTGFELYVNKGLGKYVKVGAH